jgi:hypothetical protein
MSRFRLLVALTAVAALGASSSLDAQADVSSNWAGYVASAEDSWTGDAASFSAVSGTWVQPAANCSTATSATSSAFWVGLGGDSDSSNALEQIGTEADCSSRDTAGAWAWYELVPKASVRLAMKVEPGDHMTASVKVDGTKVALRLANLTRGTTFSRVLSMAAPDTSSAEWIAEAPSLCDTSSNCRELALTDFGKVRFSNATATSGGHTGAISDTGWSADAVELAGGAESGGFGYGRYQLESAASEALPSSLTRSGRGFTITWGEAADTGSGYGDPGYDPGYGYGGY